MVIVAASLLTNFTILALIEIHKLKNKNNFEQKNSIKLEDVSVCILILSIVVIWQIVSSTLNQFNPSDENQLPKYNVYWFQHLITPLGIAIIGTFEFSRKKPARMFVIEKLKNFWENISRSFKP